MTDIIKHTMLWIDIASKVEKVCNVKVSGIDIRIPGTDESIRVIFNEKDEK